MSVVQSWRIHIRYRWCLGDMIPWYRQVLALVFGGGVMLIALWAIEQGTGAVMIGSVAIMSFVSLLLMFGVEIDTVEIDPLGLTIDFTNTTVKKTTVRREDDTEDEDDA